MRIFVSSSYQDLKEHRAAAIGMLRQLGHDVLAMEDMTAGTLTPLYKVLEMVNRSEAYVGIFAWRYGYVPPAAGGPVVRGATLGQTSVTEYEYLRAVERNLPIMAFLLDENYPWPPQLVDGFNKTGEQAAQSTDKIRALRLSLQQDRVVSWFTTPADLEARVSAAVTTAGLRNQLDLQPVLILNSKQVNSSSILESGIIHAIINSSDQQHALKIDLATDWWSTRLYLIASLAQRLTQVRRIAIVYTVPPVGVTDEHFVGQLSTNAILSVIGTKSPELRAFESKLQERPLSYSDVGAEIGELTTLWDQAFSPNGEHQVKVNLTPELLRRWFGDTMLTQPLEIADLSRASAVDILRLTEYPNEFVPVLTRRESNDREPARQEVDVIDKRALNARLAKSYLIELLDRARIF